jgi:hypothetical protein
MKSCVLGPGKQDQEEYFLSATVVWRSLLFIMVLTTGWWMLGFPMAFVARGEETLSSYAKVMLQSNLLHQGILLDHSKQMI